MLSLGAELDRVVPLLTNGLRDPYWPAQIGAVEALGGLGANGKIAAPALVVPQMTNLLHHPSLSMKRIAIEELGRFGPEAKVAVPTLVDLLSSSNRFLKEAVTNSLKAIDPEAAAKAGVK